MKYPHFARVRRPGGTTVDRNTGDVVQLFSIVYRGPCDIQDEGAVLSTRVQTNEDIKESTATIFLPERTDMALIEPQDVVQLMWGRNPPADEDDDTLWEEDAEVTKIVRLDWKLLVKAL